MTRQILSKYAANLPGTRPMGAPLSSPDGGNVARDPSRYMSAAALVDGSSKTLVALNYDRPTNVGCLVSCPYDAQQTLVRAIIRENAAAVIGPPASPRELWILGELKIGIGGCNEVLRFDIPLGQVVQFSGFCESLQITARLIVAPDADVSTDSFDVPPYFAGTTILSGGVGGVGAPVPVNVMAVAGEGCAGLSNLTRRWRYQNLAAAGGVSPTLPPPAGAAMWRVLSDPHVTATPVVDVASGVGPTFIGTRGLGNLPTDAQDRIVPQTLRGIVLTNNDPANAWGAELVYRLGLSGFIS